MNTLYIVHRDGDVIGTNLTLEEAVVEKLTHDSAEFEIRADERSGWRLWSKAINRKWEKTVIFSLETHEEAARADIFEQVRRADWRNSPSIDTASDWARWAAEAAAEE